MGQEGRKKNILIYADSLLPPSQTFIRAQGEAFGNFTPYYIGPKSLGSLGLKMPEDRTIAINGMQGQIGRIKEAPFRYFGFAPFYFRRIRRLSPVLLHAHFGPCGVRVLRLAEWLGIPLVTTFHGFDATISDSFALKAKHGHRDYVRRRHVLRQKGRLFIAVSRFILNRILEQGYPENRSLLHYIGVDTEFFSPDPDIPREPMVLFVATLHEGKGCEYVIRAMAKVQSALPEVELVVIGTGPQRAQLEQLAKENLCRYRFLGTQPPEVVRHWMNRAMVFSVARMRASSGWTEAFGLVYAEAQAMKLPVVSFASGGVPEVVAHTETGFLAPERDVEALAWNLIKLLREDVLRARMGEAARRRVCKQFNLRIQTERLEGHYNEVLRECSAVQH